MLLEKAMNEILQAAIIEQPSGGLGKQIGCHRTTDTQVGTIELGERHNEVRHS